MILATNNFKKEIESNKQTIAIVKQLSLVFLWDELGFWVLGIQELVMETLVKSPSKVPSRAFKESLLKDKTYKGFVYHESPIKRSFGV